MAAECKRPVYVLPSTTFTTVINRPFTLPAVALDRIKVAKYAVARAEEVFGWKKARFVRELYGSDADRQRINGWLKRGLPADQDATVAKKLGLTIEQLHAAGEQDPQDVPLSEEAVDFAKEWQRLNPKARTHIRGLVLEMLETGLVGGSKGLPGADRPPLQRQRSAGGSRG
jgi:hypothetical protein